MSKRQVAANAFHKLGGVRLIDRYWGHDRLTVLAYHRIIDPNTPDFIDYRPVVSASPDMFAQQMAFVGQHFNPVSLWDVVTALRGGGTLPPKPLLVTFDDGYLDNYTHAYPILKQHNIPAVIFLVTDRMDNPTEPLWWDALARAFHQTSQTDAELPLIGRAQVMDATLDKLLDALKQLPERDRQTATEQAFDVLGVSNIEGTPLFVNWEQVNEMRSHEITPQPHTHTHPILTRIDAEELERELTRSQQMIAEHAHTDGLALAYPNGGAADYSPGIIETVKRLSFYMAFTLTPGPMRWRQVQRHPHQIRRVYLSYKDTFEVFVMKVMGVPALGKAIAYPNAET